MQTTRHARKPQPRTLNLLNAPTADLWGALVLTVGKLTEGYLIREIPADFGRGFEVYKARETTTYHVHIDAGRVSCTCKGGTYCHKCKHADAVSELIRLGKLPAPAPVPAPKPYALPDDFEFEAA